MRKNFFDGFWPWEGRKSLKNIISSGEYNLEAIKSHAIAALDNSNASKKAREMALIFADLLKEEVLNRATRVPYEGEERAKLFRGEREIKF